MKKNKIHFNLILAGAISILVGCQEMELVNVSKDIDAADTYYVDAVDATMIASVIEFPASAVDPKGAVSGKYERFDPKLLGTKTVKEVFSAPGKDNKSVFHIINYEEGGFVIIAGDKRTTPILAFSYENYFPVSANTEYPGGLADWAIMQKDFVELIRETDTALGAGLNEFLIDPQSGLWNSCPIQRSITPLTSFSASCEPGGGCQDQYTQVGPLMTTTWNQLCGFNQLMPEINCNPVSPCGRAFAGCVPVAMAQVMRYHTHPTGYNYLNMPNGVGNISTATLLRDIYDAFPANQKSINCGGTGISNNADYAGIMVNNFGYSSAARTGFNHTIVKSELTNLRPVILSGGSYSGWWIFQQLTQGHMWVTDGYMSVVYCSGQSLLKLHMNWGWQNGDGNGFYNYGNFSVTIGGNTLSFNDDKRMIYNIKP